MAVRRTFRKSPLAIAALAAVTALAPIAPPGYAATAPAAALPALTSADFCARVQQFIAATELAPLNVVYLDYDGFMQSKPVIRPLTTRQFVLYEDPQRTRPMRVSCKMKTPDHLNAVYGAGSARDTRRCLDVHRDIADRVYASLTAAERGRLALARTSIVLDPDDSGFLGNLWVRPYDFAYRTGDARLHLASKSLRVNWDSLWFAWAPQRVRGTLYCHLIAPEYPRRIALGEAQVPQH
jgi:hypothetical protein